MSISQEMLSFIESLTEKTRKDFDELMKAFSTEPTELDTVLASIKAELAEVMVKWPPMNSAHEGYGVLLEEVDELWDHVKTKQKNRDLTAMKKEAVQVAAMAIRFAIEVCNEERGRK